MTYINRVRNIFSNFVRHFRISYIEMKASHVGTYLGVMWIPLSSIIFSVTLAFVFKYSNEQETLTFCIYILTGYTVWNVISDMITRSVDVIQKKWDFAVHNRITLMGLFAKQLSDKMVEYVLDVLGIMLFLILFDYQLISIKILLFIPIIILMAALYIPSAYIINVITIFYPDLKAVIRVGSRFLFFMSPVFWVASGEVTGLRNVLVRYNPVSYFLSLPRQAVGVEPLSLWVWFVASAMTCFVAILGWCAYHFTNKFVRNLK